MEPSNRKRIDTLVIGISILIMTNQRQPPGIEKDTVWKNLGRAYNGDKKQFDKDLEDAIQEGRLAMGFQGYFAEHIFVVPKWSHIRGIHDSRAWRVFTT